MEWLSLYFYNGSIQDVVDIFQDVLLYFRSGLTLNIRICANELVTHNLARSDDGLDFGDF